MMQSSPLPKPLKESELYILFRSFLNLSYSLCKQYIAWYEKEIKNKIVV